MDDKLKVFWNLDVLVKMCRSKSDGPALRVEEKEIEEKIAGYSQEIEDIKSQLDEESYDTSAEMADRNIEIITKKLLRTLRSNLKEKNKVLEELKEKEKDYYKDTSVLRETKNSYDNYIFSMEERTGETTDKSIIERYDALIAEAREKIQKVVEELEEGNEAYNAVQEDILNVSAEINDLEEQIEKKKRLLEETQKNLEDKNTYVDKTKKEKNIKRISELESKIAKLTARLEEIRVDPKYIETKIKDVISNKEDIYSARDYLIQLINIAIEQPYINVPTDNALEEELLRATQARDAFANEIDQKNYDILESNTPEKIRTDFLKIRIANWEQELKNLQEKIAIIDQDAQYGYEEKDKALSEMIEAMKIELGEYQKAYDNTPDTDLGAKATAKVALDEKKDDIIAAEKIAQSFKNDESEEISDASHTLKNECEKINRKITDAFNEMDDIRSRLLSKKSGALDIALQNKDKDKLKELAQIVIDIKHRRQFAESPIEIAQKLEEILHLDLSSGINMDQINSTNVLVPGNYDEYINVVPQEEIELVEVPEETHAIEETASEEPVEELTDDKRGYKVIEEVEITNPVVYFDEQEEGTATELTEKGIEEIENTSNNIAEPSQEFSEELQDLETLSEPLGVEEPEEKNEDDPSTEESAPVETTEEITITEEPVEEIEEPEESATEEVPEISIEESLEANQEVSSTDAMEPTTEEVVEPVVELDSVEEPADNSIDEPEDIQNATEPVIEVNSEKQDDFSINSMFNSENNETNAEKDDNISEGLLNELDQYINDLGVKES